MRKLLLVAIAATTIAPVAGQAEEFCTIALSEATATNAHSTDLANDWDGVVFGNGAATVPAGDIYREGTDLTAAWLSLAEDGTLQGNMSVADLGAGNLPNATFYMLWNVGEGAESLRWASARFKGYEVAYAYGYQTINPVTGNGQFATVGDTTGSIDVEGDTVIVNLPANTAWGSPAAGSTIYGISAETRILLGSPEPLPTNPSGLRHGFVYVADISEEFCAGIV